MTSNDLENKIKEAELRKIEAEEQKAQSEKRKIDIESQQLERPFYKRMHFIQIVIGGVLGGLAFLGVLQNIIEPAYKRDIIYKELKIANQEKELHQLKDSVSGLIQENEVILDSISKVKAENVALLKEIGIQKRKSIEIVKEQLNNLKENTEGSGILVGTIYFKYDRSSLQPEFNNYIKKLARFLLDQEHLHIKVVGYSSEIGTAAYNQQLSQRRASIVSDALLNQGISAARIAAMGMGESKFDESVMKNLDQELKERLYEMKSIVKIIINE